MSSLFKVHKLNTAGLNNAGAIAAAFDELLAKLSGVCPDGREFSIAKTKLEEACFFAKKAMASTDRNQE